MQVRRIRKQKIHEEIAEQIKDKILKGELKPGDKLPSTREFSELFQVGMSTVREALSALKAMGLVESRQGEGSYIRSLTPEEMAMPNLESLLLNKETILELLEARKALEVANAALAAEKRTEEDLAVFAEILQTMEQHLGQSEAGEQADLRFHQVLAAATHNSIIVRMLEAVAGQMETAIRETRRLEMYGKSSVSERLWQEHLRIYEAVRDRDRTRAMEAMEAHLNHVEAILFRFLK